MWCNLFLYIFISFSEGIYPPNYGYVGCYSKTMKQYVNFMEVNKTRETPFSRHKCIQHCLGNGHQYAGFSNGNLCYCLPNYNQTFAVEQKKCSINCHGENNAKCGSGDTVTIFNTRYESKLLIAVPGNDSYLVSLWNEPIQGQFQQPFNDSVFRNPDIEKWKNRSLFHKPEYVSMVAVNTFGHNIWSLNFTTNGTDNGNIEQWMKRDNILSNENGIYITRNGNNIMFHREDEKSVWFAHGDVLPEGKRVTVATPDSVPHLVYNLYVADLNCSEDRSNWTNVTAPFGVKGNTEPLLCKTNPLNNYVFIHETRSTPCGNIDESECKTRIREKKWKRFESNFGKVTPRQEEIHWNDRNFKVLDLHEPHWIKSFSLVSEDEACGEFDYILNITNDEQNIGLQLFDGKRLQNNREYDPGSYIKTKRIHIKTDQIEKACFPLRFSYVKYQEKQMMLVDKLAVIGFYHQEEPRRSKWEFLNGYSIEDIMSIMQPHLSKMRQEGAVQKRNLSASTRKKKSADDKRASSQGLGALGGCLLAFVFLIIVFADIPVLKQQVAKSFARLNYFFQSIRQNARRGQKQGDEQLNSS